MAVYFITGKLGAGKSLTAVWRILFYLNRGGVVATNLDIRPWLLLGKYKKNTRLIRVPDHPTLEDLKLLGSANPGYDETKNGLLVLDECATWFNSRTWNDKSRQDIIDWLIHSRKLGWDVLFLVQDFAVVDKQARLMLGEHVVSCARTDRFPIPIIGKFLQFFFGFTIKLPKGHVGIVKYGSKETSPIVEWWKFLGTGLYKAYDTKQSFKSNYPHGSFSYLPSWLSHGQYSKKKDGVWYMKLTKIYLRKWSKLPLIASGVLLGILLTLVGGVFIGSSVEATVEVMSKADIEKQEKEENELNLEFERYHKLKIYSFSDFPGQFAKYSFKDKDGVIYQDLDFRLDGVLIEPVDSNTCIFRKGVQHVTVKR